MAFSLVKLSALEGLRPSAGIVAPWKLANSEFSSPIGEMGGSEGWIGEVVALTLSVKREYQGQDDHLS